MKNFNNEFSSITMNSIISLGLVTDNKDKRFLKFIMRSNSLEGNLIIKKCNQLSDLFLIKESLFIIKDASFNESQTKTEKENKTLIYNDLFILQHYISKKYIAKDKSIIKNNYSLKLVDDISLALSFSLKKIKSAQTEIQFNQIFYLSAYIKDRAQYYIVNCTDPQFSKSLHNAANFGNSNIEEDYLNRDTLDVTLSPAFFNKFFMISQQHYGPDFNEKIYTGDLLNLIFDMGDLFMLGVEQQITNKADFRNLKEEVKENISGFEMDAFERERFDDLGYNIEKQNTSNSMADGISHQLESLKIVSCELNEEIHSNVNHYSLWVIEQEGASSFKGRKYPIKSGDRVRIKNPMLNLYLAITRLNDSNCFVLVEEKQLTIDNFLLANFQINYYTISSEDQNLINGGTYVIKAIFEDVSGFIEENTKQELFSIYSNIKPIELIHDGGQLYVYESDGEFKFDIKKIPLLEANESLYIKNIINQLEKFVDNLSLKKFQKNSSIIDWIRINTNFFHDYLMNIDLSFYDMNFTKNFPLTYRQNLLIKYELLTIIQKVFNFFNNSTNKKKTLQDDVNELIKQLMLFLIHLSHNNEEIKIKIFDNINTILSLGDFLFSDKTIMLFFVFKIVSDSEKLQKVLVEKLDNAGSNVNFRMSKESGMENQQPAMQLETLVAYIALSPKNFYFLKVLKKFKKVSKSDLNLLIKKIIDLYSDSIRNRLVQEVNEVYDLCNDSNKNQNIKSFLTLLLKFDLYNFIFIKESFLSYLLSKSSDIEKTSIIKQSKANLSSKEKRNLSRMSILDKKYEIQYNDKAVKRIEIDLARLSNIDYFETKLTYIGSNDISVKKFQEHFHFNIEPENIPHLPNSMFGAIFPQNPIEIISSESPATLATGTFSKFNEKIDKKFSNLIFRYQFFSCQFFKGLYSLYKILKNYCINHMDSSYFKDISDFIINVRREIIISICEFNNSNCFDSKILKLFEKLKTKETENIIFESDFDIKHIQFEEDEYFNYKYFFKFLRINNKIFFLLNKIGIFINLKQMQNQCAVKMNNRISFQNISKNLIEERNSVLVYYHIIQSEKEKGLQEGSFSFYNTKFTILESLFKHFTKILGKYDVYEYFDKIIYIKNEKQLQLMGNSAKEFKNLRQHMELITQDRNSNTNRSHLFNPNYSIDVSIEEMTKSLSQILTQIDSIYVKNILSKEKESIKQIPSLVDDENKEVNTFLLKLLQNEDSTYFRKIEFPNTLKKLIEVLIEYTLKKYDVHLAMNYCDLLLKCFKSLTKNYPNFHHILATDYDKYLELISTALKIVEKFIEDPKLEGKLNKYELDNITENLNITNRSYLNSEPNDSINCSNSPDNKSAHNNFINQSNNTHHEIKNSLSSSTLYLAIIYESAAAFLYLIENCFLYLIESKNIPFSEFNLEITRMMTNFRMLYNKFAYDNKKVEYHIFYSYLVSRILIILNRDKAYDYANYEIFFKNIFDYRTIKQRINECIKICHQYSEAENIAHMNNERDKVSTDDIVTNEYILYLNFLTIYIIYLNELNSFIQSSVDSNLKSHSIKFEVLINKVSWYLDTSIGIYEDYEALEENQNQLRDGENLTPRRSQNQKRKTQLGLNKKNSQKGSFVSARFQNKQRESVASVNDQIQYYNNFKFEFVLLQSVIFYKYEKKSIEVKIEINNQPYFLYYDQDFIDKLLLEKIVGEMQIEARIESICKYIIFIFIVKCSHTSQENESNQYNSVIKLVMKKIDFCSLMTTGLNHDISKYYKILHDNFIKNDMQKYLDELVRKSFVDSDYENICVMKFFNYVKKNNMYKDSNVTENKIKNEKNTNLQMKFMKYDTIVSKSYQNPKVKIESLLYNIKYMYQKFNESVTKFVFKSTFDLLNVKTRKQNSKIFQATEVELQYLIENLVNLFQIYENRIIVKNSYLFFSVVKSISSLLTFLHKNNKEFLIKNWELMRKLFLSLDFIFDHLAVKIEKIVKFMNSSDSNTKSTKFNSKVAKLKKLIKFITNIIKLKNMKDVEFLTERMKKFNSDVLEKIMRLIKILLRLNNAESNYTIILLIDFINNFINGPNVENLKLLFSLSINGFYDLMKYAIREIDYYNICLTKMNNPEIYSQIEILIEIEYKIMNIFFVFFNILHNERGDKIAYLKMKSFYDEEIQNIKRKLQRIYNIFITEVGEKNYAIDDLLYYFTDQEFYTESDLAERVGHLRKGNESKAQDRVSKAGLKKRKAAEDRPDLDQEAENVNQVEEPDQKPIEEIKPNLVEEEKEENNERIKKKSNKKEIMIKFELILIYYNLFILHKEVITENYTNIVVEDSHWAYDFYIFLLSILIFFAKIISFPIPIIKIVIALVRRSNEKKEKMKALFSKLYDDTKIEENNMMEFMNNHISSVEVCIDDRIYKVFFPILKRAEQIKNSDITLQDHSQELENYIYHILCNYDTICTELTQNYKVDLMFDVPILRNIFLNMKLFRNVSFAIALMINFFIIVSYSTWNETNCSYGTDFRLECPSIFYNTNSNSVQVTLTLFYILGVIQLTISSFLFFDYFLRKYRIESANIVHENKRNKAKNFSEKSKKEFASAYQKKRSLSFKNFCGFYLFALFRSLFNAETTFFMISWCFCLLGIIYHPFFFGFMLIDVIVRLPVLKKVIFAIIKPLKQILVTLFLFLLLIYYYTLVGINYLSKDYPNPNDIKNLTACILRMIDQTFKQDGGVGGYLKANKQELQVFDGLRFWYDNTFNFFVLIVIFQIFLSIMKDYFSRKREEEKKFEETYQKECITCGIEREKLEKVYANHKNAFEIHIKHDHNIYDYICYLIYLQNKSNRDRIIEENVWKLHLNNNYFFVPRNTEKRMIKGIN